MDILIALPPEANRSVVEATVRRALGNPAVIGVTFSHSVSQTVKVLSQQGPYDLAVIAAKLGDGTVFKALEQVRSAGDRTPVVMIKTSPDLATSERLRRCQAVGLNWINDILFLPEAIAKARQLVAEPPATT